jgi:hypothetical protein
MGLASSSFFSSSRRIGFDLTCRGESAQPAVADQRFISHAAWLAGLLRPLP